MITENALNGLRAKVGAVLSPKRFRHTLGVEDMVARLAALYCPDMSDRLRAAAILHDLTKEKTNEEQERLCESYGIPVTPCDRLAYKTFHAKTAAAMIPELFPEFADPVIVSAVRWHTTGHAGMTLTEKLLYLADWIDDSRTFDACVTLRRYFWDAEPEKFTPAERSEHLRKTLLLSYDLTVEDLIREEKPVARETIDARNELITDAPAESERPLPPQNRKEK